jgi:chaperonin cofactor prefoldin
MLAITFITAIVLSFVAAYYSIVGLTLIFSGAFYSILMMGSALEISKLVAVSWLYRNWKTVPILMKSYMLLAILILMLITSMGIFGFLSRAHLENSALVGDTYSTRIELLESRIKSRENSLERIESQIDSIDNSFNRYVELGSISRGIVERNQFKEERDALVSNRDSLDQEINQLREEKTELELKLKKVEVEVGPLRYIAELIYGDGAENNFDVTVRWVILIIVVVFDPLAIVLLIAANKTMIDKVKVQTPTPTPIKPKRERPPKKIVEQPKETQILNKDELDLSKRKRKS